MSAASYGSPTPPQHFPTDHCLGRGFQLRIGMLPCRCRILDDIKSFRLLYAWHSSLRCYLEISSSILRPFALEEAVVQLQRSYYSQTLCDYQGIHPVQLPFRYLVHLLILALWRLKRIYLLQGYNTYIIFPNRFRLPFTLPTTSSIAREEIYESYTREAFKSTASCVHFGMLAIFYSSISLSRQGNFE